MNLSKKLKKGGINTFNKYFKQEGSDWYLDITKDIAKYKTSPRKVWIDTPLVESIRDFTLSCNSFTSSLGKAGKMIIDNNLTNNTANVRSAFYDLRRRGKSVGKLGFEDVSTQDYMFGHNRNRIDAIYKTLSIDKHIELQKNLHKKIESPIPMDAKKEFYRLGDTEIKGDTAKEVHFNRKKRLGEKY